MGTTPSPPGAKAAGEAAGCAGRGRAWGEGAGLLEEGGGEGGGDWLHFSVGGGGSGREMKGRDRSVRGEGRWRRRALAGRDGWWHRRA